ncbi:MAG: hypothetical protein KF787_13225 [Phycisphaeraceae bacterium]|nr:hypothetical protein [Phycisphaeraceae bacterium]
MKPGKVHPIEQTAACRQALHSFQTWLMCFALIAAWCGGPSASATQASAVAAWMKEEWARAQKLPAFGGTGIRYKTEMPARLTDEERARLEEQVRGRPEHPRRHELAAESSRATHGPSISTTTLFSDGSGWRYAYDRSPTNFFDTTLTKKRAWRLTHESLILSDPALSRDMVNNPEVWFEGDESVFLPEAGYLLFGGLNAGTYSRIIPDPVRVNGDRWTMEASMAGRDETGMPFYSVRFDGRWDPEHGRGFVEKCRIVRHGEARYIGYATRMSGWKQVPELNCWVASRAEDVDAEGKPWRVLVFDGVVETGLTFDELTRVPSADGSDPLRPKPNLSVVADYRSGTLIKTEADGDTRTMPLVRSVTPPVTAKRSWLRWSGWLILGGVLLASIYLVKRRSS